MLAKASNGGCWGNAPITPARHDELATGGELDRSRRAAWVAQLLSTAGRALRACRHVVFHDGGSEQVQAYDVIAQFRAKVGGDGFRDLDCRKLDAALSEAVASKG